MKLLFVLFFSTLAMAQTPIPLGATLEKLKTGFLQPEGPVWKDGVGIIFSDIKANKIYQWSPADSSLKEYLNPSDSSNGLTFDRQGRLILTQMAKRRVSRQETNGTITPLASTYNGKKFNSPNDLVVKSDGSIFFTDPDFNTPNGQAKEIGFKGVFRIGPTGTIRVLDSTTFDKPNGLCFSPDEKKLYVNESPPTCKIYVWDVANDSTITNKQLFYTVSSSGYADGMKVDSAGNVYCTGPGGIWVISPSGMYLAKITMPETPSNCNWGDADRKTLYITAGSSLYRIRLAETTSVKDQGSLMMNKSELYANYPNPFNPSTTIRFRISEHGKASVRIFDSLGREIALVFNEEKSAGNYQVRWDAKRFSSGIYYSQLQTENVIETRKLVLMK